MGGAISQNASPQIFFNFFTEFFQFFTGRSKIDGRPRLFFVTDKKMATPPVSTQKKVQKPKTKCQYCEGMFVNTHIHAMSMHRHNMAHEGKLNAFLQNGVSPPAPVPEPVQASEPHHCSTRCYCSMCKGSPAWILEHEQLPQTPPVEETCIQEQSSSHQVHLDTAEMNLETYHNACKSFASACEGYEKKQRELESQIEELKLKLAAALASPPTEIIKYKAESIIDAVPLKEDVKLMLEEMRDSHSEYHTPGTPELSPKQLVKLVVDIQSHWGYETCQVLRSDIDKWLSYNIRR